MPGDMAGQAVIAVGGYGARLGNVMGDGRPKSLIELYGRPIIYWTLRALCAAEVRRVLLVCDRVEFAASIEKVALSIAELFESIDVIVDDGYGVHGIPVHIVDRLEPRFFLEAGNSLLPHLHYRRMSAVHKPGTWVMSSFAPRSDNPSRYPLAVPMESGASRPRVAALPYLLERDYCVDIRDADFRVWRAIARRLSEQRIMFVESPFAPEFDLPEELDDFQDGARSIVRFYSGQTFEKE
ncbi:MobA-like NTP transferase domain-containing protein [Asanoa hainanensis]|uniref:MobA-like NTP transferase domain-containing protein n=1 Tax=Asanoa hainanensis TaxID=560556 RepID=A0A239MD58_9ACTN|nr:NTP transferase domain-containing protein [Asanoa hainanensis]SNT40073.1 MobA-like NTP transferase domain-containing protein [Asanoa hainanensis]